MKSIPTPHQSSITRVDTSLVLRVCRANYTSRDDFQWPDKIGAEVVAPNWEDSTQCGNGLHGWLFGQGEYDCVDYWEDPDAKWYVLEVNNDSIVELHGKCKFHKAVVRFIGARADAANYLFEHEPRARGTPVIGLARSVGSFDVALGGALSSLYGSGGCTLTGGDRCIIMGGCDCVILGGYRSKLTGGDRCKIVGGDRCEIVGGYHCTITGASYCTITGGDSCFITGDERCQIIGNNYCTIIGNFCCTITGGNGCTIIGQCGCTIKGGQNCSITANAESILAGGQGSELRFRYLDGDAGRHRSVIAYVGEDGIEPNVFYTLDDDHKVIKAPQSAQ